MKPRNKTVEMEMQGTRGLPSVSFIKQALPVIDGFYLMTRIVIDIN